MGREAIAIPRVTLELQYFCQPSIAMLLSTLTGNTSWLDTGIVLEGVNKSIADEASQKYCRSELINLIVFVTLASFQQAYLTCNLFVLLLAC